MMRVSIIKQWLQTLEDTDMVGVDESGLTLTLFGDQEIYCEVGGLPDEETLYLDWVNNWLTINCFADYHELTPAAARKLINEQRRKATEKCDECGEGLKQTQPNCLCCIDDSNNVHGQDRREDY